MCMYTWIFFLWVILHPSLMASPTTQSVARIVAEAGKEAAVLTQEAEGKKAACKAEEEAAGGDREALAKAERAQGAFCLCVLCCLCDWMVVLTLCT